MTKKQLSELSVVHPRAPIPTIEVDFGSCLEELKNYTSFVLRTLSSYAKENPKTRLSIYVYTGPSINFGFPTTSTFFGAAGKDKIIILNTLMYAYRNIDGIQTRMSDYIDPSIGTCEFHIEDGRIWTQNGDMNWYAESHLEPEDEELDSHASDECLDDAMASRAAYPVRFRAARSDAKVGSIQKSIEDAFGLPEGSVALRGPDKKPLRSDATINTLRKRWG